MTGCRIQLPAPIAWTKLRGWELAPESMPVLDRVADTLARIEDVMVAIDVHDASRGSGRYSQAPTQKQANTIRSYLITRGVDPGRLVARGRGIDRPIAPNTTKEGREANRRVEILLSVPAECVAVFGPPCEPISRGGG